MKDEDNNKMNTGKFISILNIIDKPWEWSWVLRVIIFILYLDIILFYRFQIPLLDWSISSAFLSQNIGYLIASFALLCVIVAFVIPITEYACRYTFTFFYFSCYFRFFFNEEKYKRHRPQGCIHLLFLYSEATAEENDFKYKIYEYQLNKQENYQHLLSNLAQLTFAILIFYIIDYYVLPYFSQINHTLMNSFFIALERFAGENFMFLTKLILPLILLIIIIRTWISQISFEGWVYYPSLAEKMEQKIQEQFGHDPQKNKKKSTNNYSASVHSLK